MSRHTKLARTKAHKTKEGWPLVVFVGIFGLGFVGYIFGRLAFTAEPHPVHWLLAMMGAVLGGFVGWLWYWRRGDIA
ncbi:MAG TPA: hypothetical protein VIK33_03225 [Anaerolineae bacterium]